MSEPDYEVVTSTSDAGFLRITVAGVFGVQRTKHLFDRAAADAKHHGASRVLIDAMGVVGSVSTMAHLELGAHAASRFRGVRFVLVGRPEVIDRFGETVAVNRGADARVFLNEAEALSWLLGDGKA